MTRYVAGRNAEYRCQRILEAAGYTTARMAGSHGMWDVIAWDRSRVRFIQVKRGVARMSPLEREAAREADQPPNSTFEYWRFPKGAREPLIEVL